MADKMTTLTETAEIVEAIDTDLSEEDMKYVVFICVLDNRPRIPHSLPGIFTELERKHGSPKAVHLLQFALSQVISNDQVDLLNAPYRENPSLERWWLRDERMAKAGLRACMIGLIKEGHIPDDKFDGLKESIVMKKVLERGTAYEKNDLKFYKDLENKLFIKPGDVSKLADILRKRGLKSAVEKLEQYQSEVQKFLSPASTSSPWSLPTSNAPPHAPLVIGSQTVPSSSSPVSGYPMKSWQQTSSTLVDQYTGVMQPDSYLPPSVPPIGEVRRFSEMPSNFSNQPPFQGRQHSVPNTSSRPPPQLQRKTQSHDAGTSFHPANFPPGVSDKMNRVTDKERASSFDSEYQFAGHYTPSQAASVTVMRTPQSDSTITSASTTHSGQLSTSASFPEESPPQSDIQAPQNISQSPHYAAQVSAGQLLPPNQIYQLPSTGDMAQHQLPNQMFYQSPSAENLPLCNIVQQQQQPCQTSSAASGHQNPPNYLSHHQQPPSATSSYSDYAVSMHSNQGYRSSREQPVMGHAYQPNYGRTVPQPVQADSEDHPKTVFPDSSYSQPPHMPKY